MAGTDAKQQTPDDNAIPTRRRSRWWIPVLTFVAGIAVGVLLVGFLGTTTPDFSALQSARHQRHRHLRASLLPGRLVRESMPPVFE